MKTIKVSTAIKVFLLILVVGFVSPYLNSFGSENSHTPGIDLIKCTYEWACRHEIGHLMDKDLGEPSKTPAFASATLMHLTLTIKYGDMDAVGAAILSTPGVIQYTEAYKPYHPSVGTSPQQEAYASIYASVEGDVDKLPPEFRDLYSDDLKYDEIYKQLMEKGYYLKGENIMKEKLAQLMELAKQNKEMLIRVGCVVAGAALGSVVTAVITNNLVEEAVMSIELDDNLVA